MAKKSNIYMEPDRWERAPPLSGEIPIWDSDRNMFIWGTAGASAHAILDGGTAHTDSAAAGVTKGSLIVGNTTPAWDELVVGTDGHVLTADSAETLGVKWAAAAGGAGGHTIREDGSNLTARTGLNFIDADAAVAVDDLAGDETEVRLTQYGLLAGRAGGQTFVGGTGSGEDLHWQSTAHATKGTIFADHEFDMVQVIKHSGHINPVAITGSFNNANPTGLSTCATYVQALTGDSTLTGLVGGSAGRRILIVNTHATFTLTLSHESASSTDVNRFQCPGDVAYVISGGADVELEYDANEPGGGGSAGRWRVLAHRLPITKGDLLTYGTGGLITRAVGADDTILMASSGEAEGMTWISRSGTGDIANVSGTEAAGSADTVPRGDHVHALGIITTQGDIIYGVGAVATRLAIGSTGQVLQVVGGIPAWTTPAAVEPSWIELPHNAQGADVVFIPGFVGATYAKLGIFMPTTPSAQHSFSFFKTGSGTATGAVTVTTTGNFWTTTVAYSLTAVTDWMSVRHDTTAQDADETATAPHPDEGLKVYAALIP